MATLPRVGMLAAVRSGGNRLEVRELPIPHPGEGEVLVRMRRAGICGSDVHSLFEGLEFNQAQDPGRPGHEAVGEVVTSLDRALKPGDLVLAVAAPAFTEYAVTAARDCVPLPRAPGLDRLLMAQQLGVTIFGMEVFWPRDRHDGRVAAVLGAGPIGLNFLQVARRRGFEKVVVSDVLPDRLRLAEDLGADVIVDSGRASVVEAVMDLTGGAGADLVVEAAGVDSARAEAVRAVRRYGRVGLFGYPEQLPDQDAPFPFSTAFWKAPITIEVVKGAQEVPGLPHFREAVHLIAGGEIAIDHLLGTTYPLAEIQAAMEVARDRRALKVQIEL